MNLTQKIYLILCVYLASSSAFSFEGFPTTRFGLVTKSFTGDENISLAETKTGYGLEFSTLLDRSFFVPFAKIKVIYAGGKQSFLDGTNPSNLTYALYHGDFQIGTQINIIPRRKSKINLYLLGAIQGGFTNIKFSSGQTLSSLPSSDKGIGGGYTLGCGIESIFGKGKGQWSIYSEVDFTSYSASILNRQFDLGGIGINLGVGW